MIAGIGIDVVDMERARWAWRRWGDRLVGRILGPRERRSLPEEEGRRVVHLAGRLAAKEAVLKALGTGLAKGIRWHEIEVSASPEGAPRVTLHGAALKAARRLKVAQVHLTISHDAGCAAAAAVAETA